MKRNFIVISVVLTLILNAITAAVGQQANQDLFNALKNSNIEAVKKALADGTDLNAKHEGDGWRPLHFAVDKGNSEMVKLLVEKGADVNAKDLSSNTPLISACAKGQSDIATFLIGKGADVKAKVDYQNFTTVFYAARNCSLEVVKLLVEKGADPNVVATFKGEAPIHQAARRGDLEIIKFLLDKGVDVNKNTPLNGAAAEGKLEAVKLLLERGAKVNGSDGKDCTPLHAAVIYNQMETAKLLIERGADIHAMTGMRFGETADARQLFETKRGPSATVGISRIAPLLCAVCKGNVEMMKFLLEKGARVDYGGREGPTPLLYAVDRGNVEIVKFLLEKGADIRIGNDAGNTPLRCAVDRGKMEIVKLLVDKAVEKDADLLKSKILVVLPVGPNDRSPRLTGTLLHLAVKSGNLEVAKFLLEKGLDVNAKDKKEETVLYYACRQGLAETVKFLVEEKEAYFNITNDVGLTPLYAVIDLINQQASKTPSTVVERWKKIKAYLESKGAQ
jgi:ankyrin repeat protein